MSKTLSVAFSVLWNRFPSQIANYLILLGATGTLNLSVSSLRVFCTRTRLHVMITGFCTEATTNLFSCPCIILLYFISASSSSIFFSLRISACLASSLSCSRCSSFFLSSSFFYYSSISFCFVSSSILSISIFYISA